MCRAFETSEEGLQYCEEQFLTIAESHGLCSIDRDGMSLVEILQLHSPARLTPLCHFLHHKSSVVALSECVEQSHVGRTELWGRLRLMSWLL